MIRIEAGSLKATFAAFGNMRVSEPKAARRAAIAAGRVLRKEARASGALRDGHTPAWMASVDHPYAKRHGSIQESVLGHEGWKVHYQTGQLLSAIRGKISAKGKRASYDVFVDTGKASYAKYIIQGTKFMFPRDFIWLTATDPEVRRLMMRAMVRVMGKELRTKGSGRFS